FQAEDGIRGFHVTGVQTCALPILPGAHRAAPRRRGGGGGGPLRGDGVSLWERARRALGGRPPPEPAPEERLRVPAIDPLERMARSEERRVGKGSGSRARPGP